MSIVFQFFEIIFGYLGSYSTKKKNIFTFYVLSTVFSILMFWSVGNYAAILPVFVTGIRYFVFIFKDKYKTEIPFICCLIMHFIALLISLKMFSDIVPSVLVIVGCTIYWYLDKEKLKGSIFLLNIFWIIYYLFSGLYFVAINTIIQTTLIGIAYLKIVSKRKILLSFTNAFFEVSPKKLINLIKKYDKEDLIYGFEIASKKNDEEYVNRLAKIAYENGYKINLHSFQFTDKTEINHYLKFAAGLSKKMKRKINIVYHPVESKDYEESINKTDEILNQIYDTIEDKNYSKLLDISIENLNNINHNIRLKKEELIDYLEKYPDLKFTYDIGHELVDGITTMKLQELLHNRLNNIHIHTHIKKKDHQPIKDLNSDSVTMSLLKKYGKRKCVVMEYGIEYVEGNTFEEQLKNYINYAKIIKF